LHVRGTHIYWLLDFDTVFETFVSSCKATSATPGAKEFLGRITLRDTQVLNAVVIDTRGTGSSW